MPATAFKMADAGMFIEHVVWMGSEFDCLEPDYHLIFTLKINPHLSILASYILRHEPQMVLENLNVFLIKLQK